MQQAVQSVREDGENELKVKKYGKQEKGERRMPWLSEAMKGAVSCEKPRGGANGLRSADTRMGQPGSLKDCHPGLSQEANAGN